MVEHDPNAGYTAWGPFIRDNYYIQPLSYRANIISATVFTAAMLLAILAGYLAIFQTKAARTPLKSFYIWMIWLELIACVIIAVVCLCYLHKAIRPSFYLFMGICTYM